VKRYFLNQLVWLDIAVNTITGGSPYETISERAWRHQWKTAIKIINWIFQDPNHCRGATEGDEGQYEVLG
jgi:hypothetical protein